MKFAITTILFVAGIITLLFFFKDSPVFIPALIGVSFLYISLIAIASLSFRWNFFLLAIHKGAAGKIALTFDDGPHPETTEAILAILNRYNARATFFLIGKKGESRPEIVKKMIAGGHEIGNHSYNHSVFHGFLPTSSVVAEIERTNNTLQKLIGRTPVYYRPPYGVTNPNIARAVKKTGLVPIGWDLRSLDTVISDKQRLLNRIKQRIVSSTILLLHDSMPATVSILPELLDFCKNNGIEIVSLSEAIKDNK